MCKTNGKAERGAYSVVRWCNSLRGSTKCVCCRHNQQRRVASDWCCMCKQIIPWENMTSDGLWPAVLFAKQWNFRIFLQRSWILLISCRIFPHKKSRMRLNNVWVHSTWLILSPKLLYALYAIQNILHYVTLLTHSILCEKLIKITVWVINNSKHHIKNQLHSLIHSGIFSRENGVTWPNQRSQTSQRELIRSKKKCNEVNKIYIHFGG